ncbi:SMC-Scp complex subunit ScpB [Amycolatopsis sp. NPDC049688]|uniref:SMC-Scp complex subunit ScpB n=1 Tax=Amycolatopsis sp. NPDC049688 TaxID=3154733 RepID=UPI0034231DB3
MSPENNEVAEAPVPPAGEPEEAAAELALDEALSGEPVTEDGEPVEPLAEEAAAGEPEAPAGDAAAPPEAAEPEQAEAAEPEPVEAAESEPELEPEPAEPEPEPGPEDPESDLVAAGDADSMPDVTSDETLEAALEALLLIVDSPAGEELLADTLGQPKARIVVALRTMAQKFTDRASGIDLRRVGEGWRFYTRDVYAPFVEKLLLDGQRSKLTRAALESLAVIAYRQPVTRARVAAVRGVNVDGVIRTLLARGLIEEMGTDPETTGTLYVTTELFLERLGLSSLNDLPPIAPLLPEVDTIDDIQ